MVNPVSGTKEKSSLIEKVRSAMHKHNLWFEIVTTNAANDYSFLNEKITEEKITDVIVIGGDGTFSGVAGKLLGLDIQFGIIPTGSGNGLARTARIPMNFEKALQLILDGNSEFVDGIMINDRFACMLCGIGFDAQVAHDFSKVNRRGLLAYIRISIRNFFTTKPYEFFIISHPQKISSHAFFISIANSNQFGNNFKIAPQASLNDGLLDIVLVKKMSKLLLPFYVLGQVTGINALQQLDDRINRRNIIYFQSAELIIFNKDGAPLHIDGDPATSSPEFRVRVLPKAFRLIQPCRSKPVA